MTWTVRQTCGFTGGMYNYVYVQCVLVARYMSPPLPVGCRGAGSDSTEVASSAGQLLVECPVFASSAQFELSC